MQSELEGPQDSLEVEGAAQKFPGTNGTCHGGLPNEVISNTVPPKLECNINGSKAYGVTSQVTEMVPAEVDPLGEALNHFYDPMVEPSDFKLFSPLHSQFEAEGAPRMLGHVGNNFSEAEFENDTNENEASISDFLDSILNNSDDYYSVDSGSWKNSATKSEIPKALATVKDGISCSESDAEVAQILLGTETANGAPLEIKATAQDCTIPTSEDVSFSGTGPLHNALNSEEELSNHVNATCNHDNAVTGIRIRSRAARSQPSIENSVMQGYAPRRIRLQCKLQVSTLYPSNATNNFSEGKDEDSKPVVSKKVEVMEEDIAAGSESSKKCVLKSKTIVSIVEEIPSRCSKKFSAGHWYNSFGVMFQVAVMLILLIVLVSKMNIL